MVHTVLVSYAQIYLICHMSRLILSTGPRPCPRPIYSFYPLWQRCRTNRMYAVNHSSFILFLFDNLITLLFSVFSLPLSEMSRASWQSSLLIVVSRPDFYHFPDRFVILSVIALLSLRDLAHGYHHPATALFQGLETMIPGYPLSTRDVGI